MTMFQDNCSESLDVTINAKREGTCGYVFQPWQWLRRRDAGLLELNYNRKMTNALYEGLKPVREWNPHSAAEGNKHGAIFNFDYSTDGSILLAACQQNSFLMFDPLNSKMITEKTDAHHDCVNCIRFLDGRLFATCSDDQTIALWDVRNLKNKIRSLDGHTYWVKNIEYDSDNGLLLTSGFDGKIYTWNINNYSYPSDMCIEVYSTTGLMRSKLTPDNSKLIISTCRGYIIIIHDLDLLTLSDDLQNFKPQIYRLEHRNEENNSEIVFKYNSVFGRKRNRVEYISDFQKGVEAEVIASLQVHPQGWCVVSRNTSFGEDSEWTCVHDIQKTAPEFSTEEQNSFAASTSSDSPIHKKEQFKPRSPAPSTSSANNSVEGFPPSAHLTAAMFDTTDSGSLSSSDEDVGSADALGDSLLRRVNTDNTDSDSTDSSVFSLRAVNPVYIRRSIVKDTATRHPELHRNKARLLFYQQEPNVGEGFIKELGFSHDGRIICSPYKDGVRLFAFNDKCEEMCDCVPEQPRNLHVVSRNQCHKSYVLATKFSPTHHMYVSGCLSGKVIFHQPVL